MTPLFYYLYSKYSSMEYVCVYTDGKVPSVIQGHPVRRKDRIWHGFTLYVLVNGQWEVVKAITSLYMKILPKSEW